MAFTDTFPVNIAERDKPVACVDICIQNGHTKAGVEGGDGCYCAVERSLAALQNRLILNSARCLFLLSSRV